MKKQWQQPSLIGMGVEETKEECMTLDDKGLLVHTCKWCGKMFLTHDAEVKHEKDCALNPAHKPINPLPEDGEGLVPLS